MTPDRHLPWKKNNHKKLGSHESEAIRKGAAVSENQVMLLR